MKRVKWQEFGFTIGCQRCRVTTTNGKWQSKGRSNLLFLAWWGLCLVVQKGLSVYPRTIKVQNAFVHSAYLDARSGHCEVRMNPRLSVSTALSLLVTSVGIAIYYLPDGGLAVLAASLRMKLLENLSQKPITKSVRIGIKAIGFIICLIGLAILFAYGLDDKRYI